MPTEQENKDQELIKSLKERLTRRRWLLERSWWGNILFHLGVQWITYDSNVRRWRQKKLSPAVPTPVTNLFRATLDTVKSAIAQHSPRFTGMPERDDPRSVAAAASADAQLQIILKEGFFQRAKRIMLDWLILTGNSVIEVSWDDSPETGEVQIPFLRCVACQTEFSPEILSVEEPICTVCGGQMFDDGNQFVTRTKGSIQFDTHSPFETYLDAHIDELADQPCLLIIKSYTKEQVYQKWGIDIEGSEGFSAGQAYQENVAALATPGASLPLGAMSALDRKDRVVVIRAFVKSHKDYPDGCYLVMTESGKTLERVTPYPWVNPMGRKYLPMVHFRFGTMGGRAWGYTPADDLLPKQYQLNKAEGLFTLIISRMANPVWLIPTNTNPTRITGEIGLQIEYTPTGGSAPKRDPGSEAPSSLVRYIQDIRNSFDELSGAFSAIRGRAMGTRTPVGTVQSLMDRGFGRWATVFEGLETGYTDLAKIALEIWRKNAKTPRVQAVMNSIGGYTFREFLAADWDTGVDVHVEAGSVRPKTQQEKLQTYMQLAQFGLLDLADQSQVIKILEDIGMSNLLPGVEEDTKAAYKENMDFLLWARRLRDILIQIDVNSEQGQAIVQEAMAAMPIMVHPLVDNHAVHFLTHRRLALEEEFKTLPEVCQNVMFSHMTGHRQDVLASKIYKMPEQAPPSPQAQQGSLRGLNQGGMS